MAEIAQLETKMRAEHGLSHSTPYTLHSRDGVLLSTLQANVSEAPTKHLALSALRQGLPNTLVPKSM